MSDTNEGILWSEIRKWHQKQLGDHQAARGIKLAVSPEQYKSAIKRMKEKMGPQRRGISTTRVAPSISWGLSCRQLPNESPEWQALEV